MSGLLRTTLCRLRPIVTANVSQKATYVYGPPTQRISIMEKYVLFSGATAIMLGPMAWVMLNIEDYKSKDE